MGAVRALRLRFGPYLRSVSWFTMADFISTYAKVSSFNRVGIAPRFREENAARWARG